MSQLADHSNGEIKQIGLGVYLVSESTGNLARHISSVALSQFPAVEYQLHEHPFCSNHETLEDAIVAIESGNESRVVFSALTQPDLKQELSEWCAQRAIDHFDLMGSVVDFLSTKTGYTPVHDASLSHRCDESYYKRIEAWEFTLHHDDSRRIETIGQAEVILIGVSRVGKTPLAAYMGSLGYRVANVSIAPESPLPADIAKHRTKLVGLTIEPERLSAIRTRRFELSGFKHALRKLHRKDHDYQSLSTAFRDTDFAEGVFRRLGIRKLDMTALTVEESAIRILKLLGIDQRRCD